MITNEQKVYQAFPQDDYYHKYYYDMRKVAHNCSRCSTCKWIDSWEVKNARFAKVCPSHTRYLFDAYSCQGRMDIALALIDGRLNYESSSKLADIIYKCDTCGGCDASCKRNQDMEPLRVMLDLRAKLVEGGLILPQHIPFMENLHREDNMLMQPKAERGKWADGLDVKHLTTQKAEVVFHAGCRLCFDEELWKVARGAVTLLKNVGVDVGIMDKEETCCGGRAYDMGYQGELTKYAEHNTEAWAEAGVKTVVTACSDCYYAIKRLYPDVGSKFEVLHVVEYVGRLVKEGRIKFSKAIPMIITYHDPCHLGRRDNDRVYVPGKALMGVYEPPRELLRSIPGVELVEMYRIKEYAWCCGSGGGVYEAYPEFSSWTAAERVTEAKATGAGALVTACPWCERNFIDAIKRTGEKMKVYDVVELVQQAL